MRSVPLWALAGVALAIAVTSAMDANGLFLYSALSLFPLLLLFWAIQRFPRRSVGFAGAAPRHYVLAILFPVVVMGIIAAIAFRTGAVDLSHTVWWKAAANVALISLSTFVLAIVTEEGFFRGWLWASLTKAGLRANHVLFWSSVAFSLWHWSAITLDTGFNVPPTQIVLFMINAWALGAIWGVMRSRSGSILVSSLSHGVWNGCAYTLFGYGAKAGALGITNTLIYGPEIGALGLGLNLIVLVLLLLTAPLVDENSVPGIFNKPQEVE